MILLYPIISAIVCALIDSIRIRVSHGRLINIGKTITFIVGAILYGVSLALSVDYYDEIGLWHVLIFGIYYASIRGIIYDPVLNVLRGLNISYKSKTTNSQIDIIVGSRISFWGLRFVYTLFSIPSGILCYYLFYLLQQ
jgi:uncharacterized membrane protein (DUF2068 family)